MAGNELFETQLRYRTPHTYNALTKLVMAMASVTKNTGKKTLFGRDKGQESYSSFLAALKVTLHSMVLDGLIQESSSSDEAVTGLVKKLQEFEMAHPNWPEAFFFSRVYFVEDRADAVAVVERLRGTP